MKLEVKDISFSYQDGELKKEIFDGASCEFLDKKFYCITGPSGCGKSTLLSLLGTIDKYESGSILLDGNDIFEDESTYRKKKVGFVFQDYNLINYLDGFENVALAMEIAGNKKDENRIYGALSVVGIDKETAKRKANKLSGGEKQRIAIARALINNPEIILADEPTGNLDVDNSNMIVDILLKLAHEYDKCVIMVTHNPDIAKVCDEEYSISNKNIVRKK
ncbi:MAG: ABC transporter ATP-binding protein [Erysipelotrichaceae bacterium]|nr:ABC transporter ATP-binding protein [Solobacterium sp.]MDY3794101.1 ABC transporter ATP-binding protein [Erysipelotrichaceae bacterium]